MKGNRRFFCSLDRAVKTLRRFFFFVFLKALHEDLFDRFAAYGEIAHLRRCIPVQGEQVQIAAVVCFFQAVGDRSAGNGSASDVLTYIRICIPYLNFHRKIECQRFVGIPLARDIEVAVFDRIFRCIDSGDAVRAGDRVMCGAGQSCLIGSAPAGNTERESKRCICAVGLDRNFSVPWKIGGHMYGDLFSIYSFFDVASDVKVNEEGIILFGKGIGADGT